MLFRDSVLCATAFWTERPIILLKFPGFERTIEELKMKKLAITLSAFAALTGSAFAADLPARSYSKAPAMVAMAPSWTGFYLFGGVGGGVWDADSNVNTVAGVAVTRDQRMGGDGWFGTVGAGYDWQVNQSWVFGILADGQFGSLRGSIANPSFGVGAATIEGREKLRDTWAAGVRVGYLVAPNVLSYVNAGYTGAQFSSASLSTLAIAGSAVVATTPSFTRNGVFVGGGVENNLNIFGITAPGWFMKTEYRAAYFNRVSLTEMTPAGVPDGDVITYKPFVQTISTSLVYRFNWSGPVVAKY
jgi:outer membrane immunogenic protein